MFQRREHVGQIGQPILRPGLGFENQVIGAFAAGKHGPPFAVAAIEDQHRFAGIEPQHVAEIIALVAVKRERAACRQRRIDEEAGAAKVDLRHADSHQGFVFYSVFERSGAPVGREKAR